MFDMIVWQRGVFSASVFTCETILFKQRSCTKIVLKRKNIWLHLVFIQEQKSDPKDMLMFIEMYISFLI